MKSKFENEFSLKKFIVRYGIYIFLILVIIAAMISTVQLYKEEVLNIDPDIEYIEQVDINLSSNYIDTLNPYASKSKDVFELSSLTYESLFSYDENLGYVMELCESYTCDTEKAFIDIKLKDGVTFHDGSKLKASDVQFTVNVLKACSSTSPYYSIATKLIYCNVTSSDEVRIYFNNNYNCSLDDLVFPIVSSKGYKNYYDFLNDTDGFKPVGTGQYKFKSSDNTSYIKYIPYEEYRDGEPENNITVKIIPKDGDVAKLTTINDVSCYFYTGSLRKTQANDNNFEVYDFPSNQVEFMVFNPKSKYLRAKAFRQVLGYAIDRQKVFDNAYMSDGVLTDTFYYPNFMGVADTGTEYVYDYQKCVDFMESHGYEDLNGDGFRETVAGDTLEFRLLVSEEYSTRIAAARIIKKNLEQIGIKVEIVIANEKDYESYLRNNQFDIALIGYKVQANMDFRTLFNGKNLWGYSNNEIFEIIRSLDRLHSIEEYPACYENIKKALMDEMIYYSICYTNMSLIGIENFEISSSPEFYDLYNGIEDWKWYVVVDESEEENVENVTE